MMHLRIWFKKLILGSVLVFMCPALQAAGWTHCAEILTALGKIPLEAIARHEDWAIKQIDKKDAYSYKTAAFCHHRAAALHVVADSISIINKVLYLYNRAKADDQGVWDCRDRVINHAIGLRDLSKWNRHMQDLLQTPSSDQLTAAMNEEQETRLEYALKVVGLPCLDGLAAFAVACTQEGATRFAGKKARFVTSVAHGLVRLLDEYAAIQENSTSKRLLLAAIVVSCVWLAGEVYGWSKDSKVVVEDLNRNGQNGDNGGQQSDKPRDEPKKPGEDGPKSAKCRCHEWEGGHCPHCRKKMVTDEVALALKEKRKPEVRYHNPTTGPFGSDILLGDNDIRRILADDKDALANYEKAMQIGLKVQVTHIKGG